MPEPIALTDGAEQSQRASNLYQQVKFRVFDAVLERLELRGVTGDQITRPQLQQEINAALVGVMARESSPLNAAERTALVKEVQDEIVGLGPLEPLLLDTTIDDIIVNGPFRIYVERRGKLSPVPARFRDAAHLMNIVQRIVGAIGRRVDEASPFVDARLADGSRVNVVIPPIALDGPMLSIRKFRAQSMRMQDYIRMGAISREMGEFLATAVRSRLNILICGGTGSGKTTLLNMLSGFIGDAERLITIEDAAELQLRQHHVVRLETRPPTLEGTREVTARELVRNALRMRPDRIILGEVRGAEAVEMLQAMSTGHDGSMATMHANSNRDAFSRLEMLLGFGGLNTDPRTLRRYIANSIQLVVQLHRMANGTRRVTSVSEVTGLEGDNYTLNLLYHFEERPPMSGQGEFVTASRRPFFADRLIQTTETRNPVRPL
jgi:pilus assembly protein CpaF